MKHVTPCLAYLHLFFVLDYYEIFIRSTIGKSTEDLEGLLEQGR
jgi:hypothetical protein